MLREVLRRRNEALLSHARAAQRMVAAATVCGELEPFRQRMLLICEQLEAATQRNLQLLQIAPDDVLEEVLSDTDQNFGQFQDISDDLLTPILRPLPSDRLSLKTIAWLHYGHAQTADAPAAFSNGACAILPSRDLPLYLLPAVEQRLLLYQPVLFHEFGHLLYSHQRREMDDLVGELQSEIENLLIPASGRDDKYSAERQDESQVVVNVWYSWAQELFCDAVGFRIGGPSFAKAFSAFLPGTGVGDFYQERQDLAESSHPVTWLRIQFLADRASAAGFKQVGELLRQEWASVAKALNVTEDYLGFYVPDAADVIVAKVNDMLEETNPRQFKPDEIEGESWRSEVDSPVKLFSAGWTVFEKRPTEYAEWEAARLAELLGEAI